MRCQVIGQANANLSIYWYKTINAALIGKRTLRPFTTEYTATGYKVMEDLSTGFNRSSVKSTLTIESVQESDFAYFWCWVVLDGTHLPNPSRVVLLSPPCHSNMQQCSNDTPLLTVLSEIFCAAGTTQPVQTPQPPLCTSQPLLSPTDPNPPTAIYTSDPTLTQNLATPPQLGGRPQAWIYAVAVVGALLCGIILILVLTVAVQCKLRRKGA